MVKYIVGIIVVVVVAVGAWWFYLQSQNPQSVSTTTTSQPSSDTSAPTTNTYGTTNTDAYQYGQTQTPAAPTPSQPATGTPAPATTVTTQTQTTVQPATSPSSSGSSASAPTTPSATPVLKLSSGSSGSFLVATNGMTLYRYGEDSSGVSNCTGGCASTWPPYTVSGTLTASAGINGKLSTITRADGTKQLAYNGEALYYYGGDSKAGDTNGNGIGGVWFVVNP
jgi:predicted lipoprotein with Yx(FWY)xxD motif